MCKTYNCDYLKHSTFRFNVIDYQLKGLAMIFAGQENPLIIFRSKEI